MDRAPSTPMTPAPPTSIWRQVVFNSTTRTAVIAALTRTQRTATARALAEPPRTAAVVTLSAREVEEFVPLREGLSQDHPSLPWLPSGYVVVDCEPTPTRTTAAPLAVGPLYATVRADVARGKPSRKLVVRPTLRLVRWRCLCNALHATLPHVKLYPSFSDVLAVTNGPRALADGYDDLDTSMDEWLRVQRSRRCRDALRPYFYALARRHTGEELTRELFSIILRHIYHTLLPSFDADATDAAMDDEWLCRGCAGDVDFETFYSAVFSIPLLLMRGCGRESECCAVWEYITASSPHVGTNDGPSTSSTVRIRRDAPRSLQREHLFERRTPRGWAVVPPTVLTAPTRPKSEASENTAEEMMAAEATPVPSDDVVHREAHIEARLKVLSEQYASNILVNPCAIPNEDSPRDATDAIIDLHEEEPTPVNRVLLREALGRLPVRRTVEWQETTPQRPTNVASSQSSKSGSSPRSTVPRLPHLTTFRPSLLRELKRRTLTGRPEAVLSPLDDRSKALVTAMMRGGVGCGENGWGGTSSSAFPTTATARPGERMNQKWSGQPALMPVDLMSSGSTFAALAGLRPEPVQGKFRQTIELALPPALAHVSFLPRASASPNELSISSLADTTREEAQAS